MLQANKKPLKMKIIASIGIHPLAPRWLKIFCLQLVMGDIARGFKRVFSSVDTSKITQQQRDEINGLIAKMNRARG
ncbi:hypothetical protein NJH77_21400 [Serratia fonticola]|uniref:hypothetical protein n=1 Tax=Serratia fonticola TaxID=47917 RepID=UPI002096D65F|nr:hypothetical protein [Serratia fonticola]MCO7511810.1 hypothetical protein [Serratia fonticola]